MAESIETVVIGAGQAGLSTSYYLTQHGLEHVVLEKASAPGSAWRSERWDSFTLVTPNWSFMLPGGEYDGPDPNGFMLKAELVERFERYAIRHKLPVTYSSPVISIQYQEGRGFLVRTPDREYRSTNVIAATGWFHTGKVPPFAGKIPASILQLHTSRYRNPQELPAGAVVVVGSGQSGGQIAEELYQSGRKVFLATGTAPHIPRRYRGKDAFRWIIDSGLAERTYEQARFFDHEFVAPMFSGKDGGHALNLHKFHREGVTLMGHALDFVDGKLILAPDLQENLSKADKSQQVILKRFDEYIEQAGLDAPPEEIPEWKDAYRAQVISELDLQKEGVSAIIWACGFTYDTSIFFFPVRDATGLVDAPAGISQKIPGLYFAGFPFLPVLRTGFLFGVAQSSQKVVEDILARRK